MSKAVVSFFALVCVFRATVFAGPEPMQSSGKEMKQVAPVPVACPNWSGFYVGIAGGYKFAATDIDSNLSGDWNGPSDTDPFDKEFIEPTAPHDLDTSGAELGGLLGYNFQVNHWVFGAEAAGGYLWLRDSDNTGTFTVPSTDNEYSVATSFKTHYLATFGGRIGYTFCRWMPYVTGGVALGDVDFQQTVNQQNLLFHEIGRTDDTQVGWMVGGGLEYAINNHWRVRGQYQFIDLGSVDYRAVGTDGDKGYTADPSLELREHNVSVALIYGF